jgi:predicted Fe-Mo cluster-binding NifX family protein
LLKGERKNKGGENMELLVAFGTDDGKHLTNGHAGDAKYFYLYKLSDDKEEFVEQRWNVKLDDPSLKPGTPEMAKARDAVFYDIDALVGKKFGPGLPNLLKRFVCVIVRVDPISEAIEAIRDNLDRIREEKNREEGRKHIVLKP